MMQRGYAVVFSLKSEVNQMPGADHAGALAQERPSNHDPLEGLFRGHAEGMSGRLLSERLLEEVKCVADPARKDEMVNVEFLRWLYTALTRTTEKVYLVGFNEDFFQ